MGAGQTIPRQRLANQGYCFQPCLSWDPGPFPPVRRPTLCTLTGALVALQLLRLCSCLLVLQRCTQPRAGLLLLAVYSLAHTFLSKRSLIRSRLHSPAVHIGAVLVPANQHDSPWQSTVADSLCCGVGLGPFLGSLSFLGSTVTGETGRARGCV